MKEGDRKLSKQFVGKYLARFRSSLGGFTLLELMAVTGILAILAAIVVPAVGGTTSSAREAQQGADMNAVTQGGQRWNADFRDYPTYADLNGSAWAAGALPTGKASCTTEPCYGTASTDPLVFSEDDVAGIKFADSALLNSTTKVFDLDYLGGAPDHAADSNLTIDTTGTTFTLRRKGERTYVKLQAATATKTFPVWALDINGESWVFVNAASY